MPITIYARPDSGPTNPDTTVVPGNDGWAHLDGWTGTITIALIAGLLGAVTVWLLMRRPAKTDVSKNLMYVPLLLVNAAAVYGQVAFFYEHVAPSAWPIIGKVALAAVIAAAIESIAVYVGWHAHDALLNKAGNTAARLRRASYVIAAFVASINYAHFAGPDMRGLEPTAASLAFGLLSLLSPWLWGLHTRRMQHVQLRKEGVVDATGATFSGERIRSFPFRAFAARRWSIDNYVTDPKAAWEGYNDELRQRWATSVDSPGWWMRVNPVARVRQLTAGLTAQRQLTAERDERIADLEARLTATANALGQTRDELTATLDQLTAVQSDGDEARASLAALKEQSVKDLDDLTARLDTEHTADKNNALRALTAELTDEFNARLAEASTVNINEWRGDRPKKAAPKARKTAPQTTGPRAPVSDEVAVQMMLSAHRSPEFQWSQNAVRTLTGAGFPRIPKLIDLWHTAALEAADGDGSGEPKAVNQ